MTGRRSPSGMLTFIILASVVIALLSRRSLVEASVRAANRLDARELATLFLALGALRVNAALLHAASIRGLGLRQAGVVCEAQTAAMNTLVAGPGLALAVRISILRSWGFDSAVVATSFFATGIAPTFAEWLLAGTYALPAAVRGNGEPVTQAAAVVAPIVLVGATAFWAALLRHPAAPGLVARPLAALQRLVARNTKGFARRWLAPVLRADPEQLLIAARARVLELGLLRWTAMLAIAVVGQALLGGILALCATFIADNAVVDVWTILRMFAVYRVIAGFVPIPGGLGVVDFAMVGVLSESGLASSEAVAALAVFRALTFALPMISGLMAIVLWRRRVRGRLAKTDVSGPGPAGPMPGASPASPRVEAG